MAGEIINNIAETLIWDIFLMGIFTLLILSVGAIWAFSSIQGFRYKIRRLITKVKKMSLNQAIAITIVALAAIYFTGILFNSLSDDWIDEDGLYHLGLKPIWFDRSEYEIKIDMDILEFFTSFLFDNNVKYLSDDRIKIKTYYFFYKDKKRKPDEIINFYYEAKNKLWKNQIWREYILYSQTMINISRVWCFSFFLLFILAILRFLSLPIICFRRRKKKLTELSRPKEVIVSGLIVLVALSGYLIGGWVWLSSEKEIDNKIFGAYLVSTVDNCPDSKTADELSVELLIKALSDKNENSDVRVAAAEALGKISSEKK